MTTLVVLTTNLLVTAVTILFWSAYAATNSWYRLHTGQVTTPVARNEGDQLGSGVLMHTTCPPLIHSASLVVRLEMLF